MTRNSLSNMGFMSSPASRAALILSSLFFLFIGISTFWVYREASRIQRQRVARQTASAHATGDMVMVRAGSFTMGGIGGREVPADELPLHDVKLGAFWMDKTEVTNEQFARFVQATGYVTVAERPLNAKTTRGLSPELEGKSASHCFRAPGPEEKIESANSGWELRVGANWRHPEGEGSNLNGREKHPVVHVCYEDAMAYARWAGKRLPTEAEWEYASRGGLVAQPFGWGSEMKPEGRWMANLWQGAFPRENRGEDGFLSTAPVGTFPPNSYGLHDMAGNVAEITNDWYRPDTYALRARNSIREARRNPRGPAESYDPDEPGTLKKVTRGGSFTCSDEDCRDYRPSARVKIAPDVGRQDTGFRCVKDVASS